MNNLICATDRSHAVSIAADAAWRILGRSQAPLCLRREGAKWVAYLDFQEWIEAQTPKDTSAIFDALCTPRAELPLSFSGWIGFFGYEFLAQHLGLELHAWSDYSAPCALLGRPNTLIHIGEYEAEVESVEPKRIDALVRESQLPELSPKIVNGLTEPVCNLDFAHYRDLFFAAREEILKGNTYQIKLSQRYRAEGDLDPLQTVLRLYQCNPSPEAFLLRKGDFALMSCSPETMIERRGNRIATRPIGGTWERRSGTSVEVQCAAFETNAKEVSEHNMLVDLERNDLSRICQAGTVQVARFRELEPYAHVLHWVSTIEGQLREGVDLPEIFRALLPGGSITGCPKWRTMEIIDRLEPNFRGAYTGSFGTIADTGDLHFNLIIRTLIATQGQVFAQAGGGIVVDSTPEYEYRENQLKAQALLDVLRVR